MFIAMTALCLFASDVWSAVPSAPTLTVTTSGLTVTASWSSVTGATGYTLYYAPYPYTGPASIGSVAMGTQTSLSATLREGAAYYVAIKASNSDGSSGYSNIEHFTLTTTTNTSGSTVTDVEGNVYNTVTIGTQVWMKKNLKVTKYRDGTAIGTTTANIYNETSPKYQWAYNNDESNVSTYGRLYTWHAATDNRGVCPNGWHLPTNAEWTTLTDYLGGETVAGGKMKETGTSHWTSPNTGADNSSGFTALPGGWRGGSGTFYSIGDKSDWWSATESEYIAPYAWYLNLDYDYGDVYSNNDYKSYGFSVRCVGDGSGTTTDTTAPENTTASNFISGGASSASSTSVTLSISATDAVGVTGYYASETSTAPTASATGWTQVTSTTSYSNSSVSFTLSSGDGAKTVYVWFKDAAGNVSSSVRDTITLSTTGTTGTDVDGNVYNTVTIGTQTWMQENLKVTKYRDGTAIGTTTPATLDIRTQTSPKYQWAYNGDESNVSTYGRLYTWHAATDDRGVCPNGWHLPTNAEWTTLTDYLGGETVAGGKMKETGTSHWSSPNTSADNSSGFTALPGGLRNYDGTFGYVGRYGVWWAATDEGDYSRYAWVRGLSDDYDPVTVGSDNKDHGMSVRCVGD